MLSVRELVILCSHEKQTTYAPPLDKFAATKATTQTLKQRAQGASDDMRQKQRMHVCTISAISAISANATNKAHV